MSIVVRFNPVERHEAEVRRSRPAPGAGRRVAPTRKVYELHLLFGSKGELRVSEIWDSRESLEAYGEKVFPIMNEVGIEMASEPEIFEVQNIVKR